MNREARRRLLRRARADDLTFLHRLARLPRPDRKILLSDAFKRRSAALGYLQPTPPQRVWNKVPGENLPDALKSIAWHADYLAAAAPLLQRYKILRRTYTRALLEGDYAGAAATLSTVEAECGASIWLDTARATLAAIEDGHEAALRARRTVKHSGAMSGFLEWIVEQSGTLSSLELPLSTKLSTLDERLLPLEESNINIVGWLRLIVAPLTISPDSPEFDIDYFLLALWVLSPIDRLVALERILYLHCAAELVVGPEWQAAIRELHTQGLVTPGLAALSGCTVDHDSIDPAATEIANLYTIGDYERASQVGALAVQNDPGNVARIQLWIVSCLRAGVKPHLPQPCGLLEDVVGTLARATLPERSGDARLRLQQLGHALLPSELGLPLLAVAESLNPAQTWRWNSRRLFASSIPAMSPRCFFETFAGFRQSILPRVPAELRNQPAFRLFRFVDGLDDVPEGIPQYRRRKYEAMRAHRDERHDEAIRILLSLLHDKDTPTIDLPECAQLLWELAASRRQTATAVDLLAWSEEHYPNFVTNDRVESVFDWSDGHPPAAIENPFAWALVCSRRQAFADTEQTRSALHFAFEWTVRRLHVDRPSAIPQSEYPLSEVRFLAEVCRPSVIESSILEFVVSPDAVERERIEVLQRLRRIDPDNEARYLQELTARTKALALRSALIHAEKSKLFVNVERLREKASSLFADNIRTYLTLLQMDESARLRSRPAGLLGTATESSQLVVLTTTGGRDVAVVFETEDYCKALFYSVFRDCVEQYTKDPDYGLDRFLRLRISHGFFANHLRSPFEAAGLMFRKDEAGAYWPTEAWQLDQDEVDIGVHDAVRDALSRFSAEIDGIIGRARRRLCRLRDQSNPEGLLGYEFSPAEAAAIAQSIDPSAAPEVVIDSMFDALMRRTESNLGAVRSEIHSALEPQLQLALDELHAALAATGALSHFTNRLAECRTACAQTLLAIEQWFTLESPTSYEDYPLSLLIDAAVAIIVAQRQGIARPRADLSYDPHLQGRSILQLLDAVALPLQNAVKHENVVVRSSAIDGGFRLQFENAVTAEYSADLATRLPALNELIAVGSPESEARERGGSGLAHLNRVLSRDLKIDVSTCRIELIGQKVVCTLEFPSRLVVADGEQHPRRRRQPAEG